MAGPLQAVSFGPFEFDLRTCCLKRKGRLERLALQPGQLLGLLVRRRGDLVTREELHSQLWPEESFGDFDHGLNNAVNRLREALGDSAAAPRYIETAPRRGYRFIAEVEPVGAAAAEDGRAGRPVDGEAYDCYLRGRFYAQRQNKADNEAAMAAFERAVALDPSFALAYAELAQTYVWKLFLFAPHERQWQEKAFMAVEKALLLEPELGVAYLARGRLLWTPANHFPHVRAIRDYRRAIALNPGLDEARNQLALIYCHIGFFEEALRESQEAALVNPNNHLAIYRTAQTLAFQGKYEQALAMLQTVPREVNPALIGYQTAWVLFNLGRNGEAAALVDQLLMDFPEDDGALYLSMQAVLAAAAGEVGEAEVKIEEAIRKGSGFGHFHHSAYHIAVAFAGMDKLGEAVRWLEFASQDGFPCYPLFEQDGLLQKLRVDAGFVEFMVRLRERWEGYREAL